MTQNWPPVPRSRRPSQRFAPDPAPPVNEAGAAPLSPGILLALCLLALMVPILLFNQHHSGDPVKIRRELRKF